MPELEPEGRVVSQRAVQLLTGHAGLHELGFDGGGQTVGFLDDDITADELAPFIDERLNRPTSANRPRPTHGDEMAAALVQAAPGARLGAFNVFDRHGSITRRAIREGMEAVRRRADIRLTNVSLQIVRNPAMCSAEQPCSACTALRESVDAGMIVVVAAGNHGAAGPSSVTCPAAESGGIVIGATTGPPGSSRAGDDLANAAVSGTSVSSAMVTGGLALLLQALPSATDGDLRRALADTATKLPNAPTEAVGAGRAHFYRAFRYLEHRFRGGQIDPTAAETLANRAVARLGVRTAERPLTGAPDGARQLVGGALALAPWSSELWLWVGLLNEERDPGRALEAAAESVRLDWAQAPGHRLIARLLLRMGDTHGAQTEDRVANLLVTGQTLEAADELFEAMANR